MSLENAILVILSAALGVAIVVFGAIAISFGIDVYWNKPKCTMILLFTLANLVVFALILILLGLAHEKLGWF